MAIAGTVVHPGTNLSPIVGVLLAERMSQLPLYRAAQVAAPIFGRRSRKGTALVDATTRGLNLQAAPKAAVAGSLFATEYPSQGASYSTLDYEIKRYLVDQQDVPDAVLTEWAEQAGISLESRVADLLAERVAAIHAYNTWATLGDTSTGFTAADPGNITSASFSLITLFRTVRTTLEKAQRWATGSPMDVFVSTDVLEYIALLSEVRARMTSQSATNTIPTPGDVDAFFSAYLPGARVVPVASTHVADTGTVTYDFSGKILFMPDRPAPARAAVTFAPEGPAGVEVASVRQKRLEEMPGTRFFADGHMDVKITDPSGAYLAHGLLT